VSGSASIEYLVLAELLAIRKSREGVTLEAVTQTEGLRQLLGSGDPYLAYSRFRQFALQVDLDVSVQAAVASLGFSTYGDTHLSRLTEFGEEVGLEQRQARRHSDKGLRVLARLIASNWAIESSPQLTVIVIGSRRFFEIHLLLRSLLITAMKRPAIWLSQGVSRWQMDNDLVDKEDGLWGVSRTRDPIVVNLTGDETSLEIVWRGELWPLFRVIWQGARAAEVASETLGNKLMLRLTGSERDV
jgi:hypothetical protein